MFGKKEKLEKIKIIFSLLFTLFFFSLFEIVSKKINLNSFSLTGLRFFFGGLLVFIVFFKSVFDQLKRLEYKIILKIVLTGFLNVCVAMLSLQLAVKFGNATTSAIIISSNPVFVFIIQNIIENIKNKDKKFNIQNLIRFIFLIVGVLGIFLVVYKKDKGDNIISIFFALLAAITFASYTIISKKLLNSVGSFTMNSISFSINGFILIVFSIFIYKSDITIFLLNIDIEKILLLFTLAFGVTGFAYITYFYALKRLDAVKVSLVFYLKPIVVLILNFLFLGEAVGFNKFIGIFIILASLIVYINIDNIKKICLKFFN